MKGQVPGHGRWQNSDDTTNRTPSNLLYFFIWILYTVFIQYFLVYLIITDLLIAQFLSVSTEYKIHNNKHLNSLIHHLSSSSGWKIIDLNLAMSECITDHQKNWERQSLKHVRSKRNKLNLGYTKKKKIK